MGREIGSGTSSLRVQDYPAVTETGWMETALMCRNSSMVHSASGNVAAAGGGWGGGDWKKPHLSSRFFVVD